MTAIAGLAILSANQTEIRLQPAGGLNAETAADWRDAFETAAASKAKRVVLDLEAVNAIDGSGIGAIAYLFKRLMARDRTLVVQGASGQPRSLLNELGLAATLGVEKTPARSAPRSRWFGGFATAAN